MTAGCNPAADAITGTVSIGGGAWSGPLVSGRFCSPTGIAAGSYPCAFTSTDARWSSGSGSFTVSADCATHTLALGSAVCPYFCNSVGPGSQLVGPSLHFSARVLGISCTLTGDSNCHYSGSTTYGYPGCPGSFGCNCPPRTVTVNVLYIPGAKNGSTSDYLRVQYMLNGVNCGGGIIANCPDTTGPFQNNYLNDGSTPPARRTINPFSVSWDVSSLDFLYCTTSGVSESYTVSQ